MVWIAPRDGGYEQEQEGPEKVLKGIDSVTETWYDNYTRTPFITLLHREPTDLNFGRNSGFGLKRGQLLSTFYNYSTP